MLSISMTARLASLPGALLVVPHTAHDPEAARLDDHGRGYPSSEVDRLASRLLELLTSVGAQSLVVEDDLARRGDPGLEGNVAFVDDRVVRWANLGQGADAPAALLRGGSSGYPLNAFVSSFGAGDLMLAPGSRLQPAALSTIVNSAMAVIASVYDAEAYVALIAPEVLADIS
jgi:hypothetical protein